MVLLVVALLHLCQLKLLDTFVEQLDHDHLEDQQLLVVKGEVRVGRNFSSTNLLVLDGFFAEGFPKIVLFTSFLFSLLLVLGSFSIRPSSMSAFSRNEGVPQVISGSASQGATFALIEVAEDSGLVAHEALHVLDDGTT